MRALIGAWQVRSDSASEAAAIAMARRNGELGAVSASEVASLLVDQN